MLRRIVFILFMTLTTVSIFAQMPPVEPGVSQALARWRAANYSDVRYRLDLKLEKGAPALKGAIEIRLNVKDAAPIVLDWRRLRGVEGLSTVGGATLNGAPARFEDASEHLVFRDGVRAGENTIRLDFTSPIAASGAALTRYIDKEDGAEYVYTLFVPSDASTAFPVFDQPDLKARFKLNVVAPKEWKVVSNSSTPLFRVSEGSTDTSDLSMFEETKPISTYVFAFAAGDFAEFEDKSNPTTSRASGDRKLAGRETSGTIYRTNFSAGGAAENSSRTSGAPLSSRDDPGRFTSGYFLDASSTQDAPTQTSKIYVRKSQAEKFKAHEREVFRLNRESVKYLESYFDYKFPFPKYDLVLIPEFPFGGMEHAGATFLREASIIFPSEPTANDFVSRANLIFHEAAHQWFGDTVTMKWFDDLWLKEGFAEFMAYKTLEKVLPEYDAWKAFYERNKPLAYLTDSTKGTTPIYQEIPNLSAAKSAYGNIVYRKAPSFLRQAEFYLGEKEFQTAVRAFLKKHEFKNAEWTDLVREFEAASKQDLKDWADVWVKQAGLFKIRVNKVPPQDSNPANYSLKVETEHSLGASVAPRMKFMIYSSEPYRESKNTMGWELPPPKIAESFRFLPFKSEPYFIFPNYGDFGYGIFLLDEKSRDYVLKNIQHEKDAFLRSMMWGALWDSVREAELDPKEYVELAVKNIAVETDELTIQTILSRVGTAMNYYLAEKTRDELAARLEAVLLERIASAKTQGQRITFYRAYLNLASSGGARKVLKDVLAGRSRVAVFQLRTKDKFDLVTRLLILGDQDAPRLLENLEKTETSDDAKRYAYAARAAVATSEAKARYFRDFLKNKDLSESWIEAAFVPFNAVRHARLTGVYLETALAELPNLKRSRKIFFVNGWLGAFLGGQTSAEALAVVQRFLENNRNLDRDLRLKILENMDGLERAVKIREKYGR